MDDINDLKNQLEQSNLENKYLSETTVKNGSLFYKVEQTLPDFVILDRKPDPTVKSQHGISCIMRIQ